MIISEGEIAGVRVIDVAPMEDSRGFFARTYCVDELTKEGVPFVIAQENVSYNKKRATLRGMHLNKTPYEEGKIVRCTRGAIFDVVIDLRVASQTYLSWEGFELTESNRRAVYIPEGCAHGFLTLKDDTEVFYMMNRVYVDGSGIGYRYDDSAFGIAWPCKPAIISERDLLYPKYDKICAS